VDPLTVWYEDLSADPGGTVSAVLAWLGEDPPLPVVAHREGVQRDAMSEDWAARFRRGA
jgi:LPS sulfotransferase NodH